MNSNYYFPTEKDILSVFPLTTAPLENGPRTEYWLQDGQVMWGGGYPVKKADPDSFESFLGGFAKDRNRCYVNSRVLKDADPKTFRPYSYCYFGDGHRVWTMSDEIKEVDPSTFIACDKGILILNPDTDPLLYPTGYAKDKNHVYFCDAGRKGVIVKKADPNTFTSIAAKFGIDDHLAFPRATEFGIGDRLVFWGRSMIPQADPKTWRLIGGCYSSDIARVYYLNRIVKNADPATFRSCKDRFGDAPYGLDKNGYFDQENEISKQEFEKKELRY